MRFALLFRLLFVPVLLLPILSRPLLAGPITITHRFGVTEIAVPPQRIVSVGYHEQDFLYALGIAPVGVHEWFGDRPHATWPWAEPARMVLGAEPAVQRGFEIDLEWVWQQHPDLIVATFAPMDAATYARLSRIAPVVGPPRGYPDWGAPWQEELRLIAAATGREEKGEAVIADVEGMLRQAAAAHPEFAGHDAAVAYVAGTTLVGYGPADGANRLLAALGLTVPPEFAGLATAAGNFSVSLERIDLFDHDVTLWLTDPGGRELVEALPAYQTSRMAREERSVWADELEIGAMSFQSPLSIPWLVKRLVPRLAEALAAGNTPSDQSASRN